MVEISYPVVGDDSPAAAMIRSARSANGLSQSQLAARLGTTQPSISRWESGHDEPRISTLAEILRACGMRLVLQAAPDDVDRAQIREQLALTPQQRLDSIVNVSRMVARARRVG